jgi:hypothetical protein
MVLNSLGVLDDSASLIKARSSEKEIVFIPMHHIGKKQFYEDVKNEIDSLRNQGFVFYYEGVKLKDNNSLQNDTLRRKVRKILGVDVSRGYIDTINNTLFGVKSKNVAKYKLVNQPKNDNSMSGLDTTKDRRVDVYLSDLLEAFEKKYGTLVLNDCDFNTEIGTKYSCSKYKNKEGRQFILSDYRNNYIANEIVADSHTKIALLYGAKHFEGIYEILQKQDPTWKIMEK